MIRPLAALLLALAPAAAQNTKYAPLPPFPVPDTVEVHVKAPK